MRAWENCYTQKANQFKLSATHVSGDYLKKKRRLLSSREITISERKISHMVIESFTMSLTVLLKYTEGHLYSCQYARIVNNRITVNNTNKFILERPQDN